MRFEAREEVRVVRLRTAQRPFDGTDGALRAPQIGDVGSVVQAAPTNDANATVLVACVATDGATLWRAEFTPDELEATAPTIADRQRRVVRRARRRVLGAALALGAGVAVALAAANSSSSGRSPWLAAALYLTVLGTLPLLVVCLCDLGRALAALPRPTRLERVASSASRTPPALLGVIAMAVAVVLALAMTFRGFFDGMAVAITCALGAGGALLVRMSARTDPA